MPTALSGHGKLLLSNSFHSSSNFAVEFVPLDSVGGTRPPCSSATTVPLRRKPFHLGHGAVTTSPDTYLGFAQGGKVCRGPGYPPLLQNQELFGFGPLFLGEVLFYEKKYKRSLTWGPTQIATRDPVTPKFELHGLRRSTKGPVCSSSGVL